MDWLKRLLIGGGGKPAGERTDRDGVYVYVQPNRCDEVVRVRINRNNDLTERDEEAGFYVQKQVRGTVCFTPVELTVFFDANRSMTDHRITGGVLVDEAAWQAWIVTRPTV